MKSILTIPAALVLIAPLAWTAPLKIVSFSPVLTELAEAVGGETVEVDGVITPGIDPHDYSPTPRDLKSVADARLVLVSGNGMERYLDKLRADAGSRTTLIEMGALLPTLQMEGGGHHHHGDDDHHHDHDHGPAEDPHWWHSIPNVIRATRIIRDALIELDPAQKAVFTANADVTVKKLEALQRWVKQRIAELPRDRRQLVTSHDAFQYFAKEYGFEVHSVEGVNREKQASAKEVVALMATIREKGVQAIFVEDNLNPKVSSELTRETGAKVGGTLVADGLGTGASSTYEGMMRHNVNTIIDGLK